MARGHAFPFGANEMIEKWWPTPIYYSFIEGIEFDKIQNDFSRTFNDLKSKNKFSHRLDWNSNSLQLSDVHFKENLIEDYGLLTFKEELFKHLVQFVAPYADTSNINFKVKACWMTLTSPGEFTHIHHHSDSDISGVYYFKTSGNDGSIFFEPNNVTIATSRVFKKGGPRVEYKPEIGKLMLFPGFLYHGVHENNTKEERVSVSFNIEV
jgi:uncharacterized protein (TIGR02466 family)